MTTAPIPMTANNTDLLTRLNASASFSTSGA